LKRLASGHVFYELPGSDVGAWDQFSTRNIGLRVNRKMVRAFGGNANLMRDDSRRALQRTLGVNTSEWTPLEKAAFDNFALALTQATELRDWTEKQKHDLVAVIRAKANSDEMIYLHFTQWHDQLRRALLRGERGQ
jgi:hypothetical protein